MKKNIFKLITIITILLSLLLIKTISNLNILPGKYYYLIITCIFSLNIINIILLKPQKKYIKIISIILNTILITISIIGIIYGEKTINFIKNNFNNQTESTIYNVIVLDKSDYQTIEELDFKNMGYFKADNNSYLEKLNEKINPVLIEYEIPFYLYDELLNKNIDAIIINEAYLDILEEYINMDIRIIYSFEIKQEKETTNELRKLKNVNILISGSDSRSGIVSSKSRSDVNMIMTINIEKNTILLTSIPRDYYVQLHGTTGNKDKLTHSGIYGIEMTKKTIEQLFDIKIDYSIKVGFKSVINMVDLVGGIDIESDLEFISHCRDGGAERTHVKKGMNHFTGAQALSYARERYAYVEGDRHRILNQQQVLEAVMNKIFNDKSLLLKYNELLNAFSSLYITDIPSEFIQQFIKNQINNMNKWTIIKQSVNGTGASYETYSMPGRKLYVMIPNITSITNAKEKINELYEIKN